MSTRDGASLTSFKYCLFKKDYSYALEIYTRLIGDGVAFRNLVNWMLEDRYKLYDIYDVTASDCKLSLSVVNPKWSEEIPRGGCEYKIKHTGISVIYDYYVENPVVLGLCIPNGLKPYLEVFDSMNKELQPFIINRTKKCDGCRYCIQTDKSGSRPLACIPIDFDGNVYKLCPYFPGYNYSWADINDDLAGKLIKMLTFMDTLAPS